jgi:hypothetical protein
LIDKISLRFNREKQVKRIINLLLASVFLAGVVCLVLVHATAKAIEGEIIYTGTNTELSGDDEYTEEIDLGFDFGFNGFAYSTAYININGTLNFGEGSEEYDNEALPTSTMGPAIMAFWDDIITTPQDVTCDEGDCDWDGNYPTIYYKTVGEEGSRKFIVQWTNMYFYSNPEVPLGTFQIILYEGTNIIQMQYRDLLGGDRSAGSSTTVGLNFSDEDALQYFYNDESLDDGQLTQGQAISFTPGEGYTMDDSATYDLVYLVVEGVPSGPTLIRPEDSTTNAYINPTFEWQAEDLADTYRIIVSDTEDFSNIVINESNLTDTTYVPETALDADTEYYWMVEAINDSGSNMSDAWSFTTGSSEAPPDDEDGVEAETEAAAPNEGDANNDGTADSEQSNVASLVNPVTTEYAVLETAGCETIKSVDIHPVSDNATADAGYNYPAGMANFTITCAEPGLSTTVTLYYYGINTQNFVLRKFNSATNTYSTISNANISNVTIGGQAVVKVVYQLTDGGALDQDGEANGTIVDPAGPASLLAVVPNTGFQTKSLWPAVVVITAGGGLALAVRRRCS